MLCCRSSGTLTAISNDSDEMVVTVQVSHCIPGGPNGSITCTTYSSRRVHYEWKIDGETALIQLNDDRNAAYDLKPGRYEIVASSDTAAKNVFVDVRQVEIAAVVGYVVTHATNDSARDGSITVKTTNSEGCDFLWTNGRITNGPTLHDVQPGTYVATPVRDGVGIVHVQSVPPAVVLMSRHL